MITKLNSSGKVRLALYALIFAVMLLFNVLSPYIMDDYKYLFSFADDTRMEHLSQLIPSIAAHAHHMNGRLVAHAWVQLFAMLPMWLFDVVNSLVFVLQLMLFDRISRGSRKTSNLMIPVTFCLIWLFEPVYAQANLWQDGACNYLWSIVFCLIFLLPFVEDFMFDRSIKPFGMQIAFVVWAFFAGAYTETLSAASIFMAGVLVLVMLVYQKKKMRSYWVISLAAAFAGYISIYLAPAQWVEKAAEMHPRILFSNLVNITNIFRSEFGLLTCVFVVLLVIHILEKTDVKTLILASTFFLGALAAHYIMMFAGYYTPRSSIGAFALLAISDLILMYALLDNLKHRVLVASALTILVLATVPAFLAGTLDIMMTSIQLRQNEARIVECRENGILNVELPLIESSTKYSIANGRKYLDEDPSVWPNYSMADYYGVETISIAHD